MQVESYPLLRDLVRDSNLVDAQALEHCIQLSKENGVTLAHAFVRSGVLPSLKLARFLARALKLDFVDLGTRQIPTVLLQMIDDELADTARVLPVALKKSKGADDVLLVAMSDPTDRAAVSVLTEHTRLKIERFVADEVGLQHALNRHFPNYYARAPDREGSSEPAGPSDALPSVLVGEAIDDGTNFLDTPTSPENAVWKSDALSLPDGSFLSELPLEAAANHVPVVYDFAANGLTLENGVLPALAPNFNPGDPFAPGPTQALPADAHLDIHNVPTALEIKLPPSTPPPSVLAPMQTPPLKPAFSPEQTPNESIDEEKLRAVFQSNLPTDPEPSQRIDPRNRPPTLRPVRHEPVAQQKESSALHRQVNSTLALEEDAAAKVDLDKTSIKPPDHLVEETRLDQSESEALTRDDASLQADAVREHIDQRAAILRAALEASDAEATIETSANDAFAVKLPLRKQQEILQPNSPRAVSLQEAARDEEENKGTEQKQDQIRTKVVALQNDANVEIRPRQAGLKQIHLCLVIRDEKLRVPLRNAVKKLVPSTITTSTVKRARQKCEQKPIDALVLIRPVFSEMLQTQLRSLEHVSVPPFVVALSDDVLPSNFLPREGHGVDHQVKAPSDLAKMVDVLLDAVTFVLDDIDE